MGRVHFCVVGPQYSPAENKGANILLIIAYLYSFK